MGVNASSVRAGDIIQYNNDLCRAIKVNHVTQGRGGAIIKMELKKILDGTKMNISMNSAENVEKVRLEEEVYQYLYQDGEELVLMHKETYDQINVPSEMLGDMINCLQDGMDITVSMYDEKPIALRIPEQIILEVEQTEPVVKGQTATASYKPAILTGGSRIMVPPFINIGDKILIKTSDFTYIERAKN